MGILKRFRQDTTDRPHDVSVTATQASGAAQETETQKVPEHMTKEYAFRVQRDAIKHVLGNGKGPGRAGH